MSRCCDSPFHEIKESHFFGVCVGGAVLGIEPKPQDSNTLGKAPPLSYIPSRAPPLTFV